MSEAFLQRSVVLVLKRAGGELSPGEIQRRLFFRWRKKSLKLVSKTLRALRDKGCVVCAGSTRNRKCAATSIRPTDMTGKSPGSEFGRAMAREVTRRDAHAEFGTIPAGTALERAWPMMFGQHPETEEDE